MTCSTYCDQQRRVADRVKTRRKKLQPFFAAHKRNLLIIVARCWDSKNPECTRATAILEETFGTLCPFQPSVVPQGRFINLQWPRFRTKRSEVSWSENALPGEVDEQTARAQATKKRALATTRHSTKETHLVRHNVRIVVSGRKYLDDAAVLGVLLEVVEQWRKRTGEAQQKRAA